MFAEFINTYGVEILGLAVTAIASYIGLAVKRLAAEYINDKQKKAVAKTVVRFVEQVYKDIHGEEKLTKALEAAAGMLNEKGITVTDLELRILVEAAVGEFNAALKSE